MDANMDKEIQGNKEVFRCNKVQSETVEGEGGGQGKAIRDVGCGRSISTPELCIAISAKFTR